ncbi:MAG TPA: ABC transporter substrate-binding protein [Chloroflexota bacterium]
MKVTVRVLSLVLISWLAGCGGTAPPANSAPAPASAAISAKPAVSGAASAPASAKPTASTGASTSVSAAAGGSIRIGYITDLTGTTAQFGKDGVDGTNLFFDSLGGSVAGRKIEVIPADDEIKPDVGVTKAKQLVESQHVAIIMGVLNTAICYALGQWAKDAQQAPVAITQGCAAQFFASDPRFSSAYVSRFSLVPMALADPLADWSIKQGHKKAAFITFDQAGGLEPTDLFAAAFIRRGGTVVQEQHPPFPNNPDFGPYLAQLDPSADVVFTFEPGIDGLRLVQQSANYGPTKKAAFIDFAGVATDPSNLAQEKDAALDIVNGNIVDFTSTSADYQKMSQAWKAKYGDRPISANVVNAYSTAQVLGAAIQKVNGNVEDKQAFLNALYSTDIQTVRGPSKLDSTHEPIQNTYLQQVVKQQDGSLGFKLLATYPSEQPTGSFTPEQLQRLKPGQNKGKWPGFTQAQLTQLLGT